MEGRLQELDLLHRSAIEKIVAANPNIVGLNTSNFRISYDPENDILACNFGPPRSAVGESIDNIEVLRVDPSTSKLLGIEITNFKKWLLDKVQADLTSSLADQSQST